MLVFTLCVLGIGNVGHPGWGKRLVRGERGRRGTYDSVKGNFVVEEGFGVERRVYDASVYR